MELTAIPIEQEAERALQQFGPEVLDDWDRVIHAPGATYETDQEFRIALSRIPTLFGSSKKATYLAMRSIGLADPDIREVLHINYLDLKKWRETDSVFSRVESEWLRELQSTYAADIARLSFLRNMMLFYTQDARVLSKASKGIDVLSAREFSYYMNARRYYTPNDLLALEKAIAPEKHRDNITVKLSWNEAVTVIQGNEETNRLLESGG